MDIREKVMEIRNERDKKAFVSYFVQHPDQLDEMFQLVKNLEPYPYKEYASWAFIHMAESKQFDLQYLYNDCVDLLFKTEDQTVLRNVVRLMTTLEITDYKESDLIDQLIGYIQNFENKVALQVHSMTVLVQFCKKYPELIPEIKEILELNSEGKSAAYRARQRSFLKFAAKYE